jgi:probable rRNA maturation factor
MIEFNNLTDFNIDRKLFTGIAKKALKGENKERENLSIAFIGPAEIKKLNKKYRGKDKPTDVLSFDYGDDGGEIVICPQVVKENAKKDGGGFRKELAKVLAHGILHLAGYDHCKSPKEAEAMEKKQEAYLRKIK